MSELIPVPESWRRNVPALELAILDIGRMDDLQATIKSLREQISSRPDE